jgi:hypothetical protein
METKIVYQAKDGKQFDDEFECFEYEEWCKRLEAAMCMPEIPRLDSDQYYQHTKMAVHMTRRRLFKLYLERYGDSFPDHKDWNPDTLHPMCAVGRILDDAGGPLRTAWGRLMNTDMDTYREYNQPYYVMHPQEAPNAVG